MTILPIAVTQSVSSAKFADVSPHEMGALSLDDRLRDAFVSSSVSTQNEYEYIMSKINGPKFDTTPAGLLELQVHIGDYKQDVEIISALTRKGVATIEALLRT
ncbi:type III secretion system inner rod subunit SctI [Glaciimonas sp. Gout2]|uniref:type III secretion system inner rod subunit SctI n=1 Tax=unclassified Glaciimonas TaxID=2644401 RepID=UPI002B23CDBB|nr:MULTISPECIES: type III secretion system inner rod subunit SctI [unclassified Glaciimonas]MEB0010307.1 type III secretion system inner rod subunit SctI [Glaciimonas sp. Cout2]MEB0084772.1 type III secretion system inner rod subunit SctI [Glaciimonas sp. Gout2]